MIEFARTIGASEVRSTYLNLTDDHGRTFGPSFGLKHRTKVAIEDSQGRFTTAQTHHANQIWGTLYDWMAANAIKPGTRICVRFDRRERQGDLPVIHLGREAVAPAAVRRGGRADEYWEGGVRRSWITRYDRDLRVRAACLGHYGCRCDACTFDFGKAYGPAFAEFIHVHHLKPLRHRQAAHKVDRVRDLRPICPNCHAVAHLKDPPHSISEIRKLLKAASGRG